MMEGAHGDGSEFMVLECILCTSLLIMRICSGEMYIVCGNDFTTSPTKTTKTSTLGPCRNLGSRSRIIRLLYSERAISLSDADCKEVEVCRPPWIESRDRMRCEDILISWRI